MKPEAGKTYDLRTIEKELDLRDSPFLRFRDERGTHCIQTSHLTEDELLELPNWAKSRWTYQYETHEWIPLFMFASDNSVPITELVDIEPDEYLESQFWVVPKSAYREQ